MPKGTRKQAANSAKRGANGANLGFEEKLWLAADKLRGHPDAAEYKHVVLGLIFLKYISDAFEERHARLLKEAANPKSEYYVKDERALRQYQNRSLEAAQVITELIELAKQMREAHRRGEDLGLSDDELAFHDALEVNDSAVKVLGDETLRAIARELVETVRRNVTIDWTVRESVRAKLRITVKRVLRKHGYPPDKQEKATLTVLEQAELIARDWAG